MTNILIHSNGPHVPTGYGVQTALLAERMKADGHNVAVSCTYGQQGAIGTWRGITLYPTGMTVNSADRIHHNAYHHFGGDELNGWVIPLADMWSLEKNHFLTEFNVAAWCPVDHFPVPPDVRKFFEQTDAVPVAMSKYGFEQLSKVGLDPVYVPLAVDTKVYRPTFFVEMEVQGEQHRVAARDFLGVPKTAFVVGMVAMNKGWSRDRKGFNEAFRAFGEFWRKHNDAVLYVHSCKSPIMEGIDLAELALHAGIPSHAIVWPNQYAYQIGFKADQMAATYTAMDVLLAPSHGEGFCVPLIEAQACGVPVIASNFSAQPELVGAGWLVKGQLEWDPPQHASYFCPDTADIVAKLEEAYHTDLTELSEQAITFAAQYDADTVYETHWRPFLETLKPPPLPEPRQPMGDVAVIVPLMREQNEERFLKSFAETNDGTATLYIVESDYPQHTYAQNVNAGYRQTSESWVCVVGDDVEFKPGWLAAARKVSERFDVIGTNDTADRPRNPDVASGSHADHFFLRRDYIENEGSSLDGPGTVMPEAYGHWWVDREVIGLAKARGVFTPCLDSVIVHHHPGFDGREDLRQSDPVYMRALEHRAADEATFLERLPLIEMHRVGRGKVR